MRLINTRLFLAWILSLPLSYYSLGFVSNFYSAYFELTLLALLIHSGASIFFYFLSGRGMRLFQDSPVDFGINTSLFVICSIFVLNLYKMAGQFTSLFDASYFLLEKPQLVYFIFAIIPALPISIWLLSPARQNKIKQTLVFKLIQNNLPGLLISFFFFSIYLLLASILNRPAFDVDDIFFDTDGLLWRMRFTTPAFQDYYWRSVHPFVLLVIRPLITLTGFFLKGDRLAAAFVLVALSGALCVFLTWYFVKHTIGNSPYALLIAALLGASASHLVFGSLIETYVFLSATALIFLVLLLKDGPLFVLIITGTVSFGITITNFAQTIIAFIFVKQDFKQWVRYGLIVAALTVPLSLLNNFVYPDSQPYFFIPSNLNAETENTFAPSIERASAILRVMSLHSIVAPDPLILQEEIPFLKVWMFKADPLRLSKYESLFGRSLAYFWLGLLLLGALLFLKNLKKEDHRFPFALICILLFNFALHLRYGKDLFLYSANWTYAIILLLALAWKDIADKKWFQVVLLVFLGLLLANNSRLIFTMLSTSAMHIK